MDRPQHEPLNAEFELLLTGEERDMLSREDVPDDVRAEIFDRLESRRDAQREREQAES